MSSQEVVDFVRTRLAKGNRNPEELTTICEAVSIQMPSSRVNTRWKPTLLELYSVSSTIQALLRAQGFLDCVDP